MTFDLLSLAGILTSLTLLYLAMWSWWSEREALEGRLFTLMCLIGAWWAFWIAFTFNPDTRHIIGAAMFSQLFSGYLGPVVFLLTLAHTDVVQRFHPRLLVLFLPGLAGTLACAGAHLIVPYAELSALIEGAIARGMIQPSNLPGWLAVLLAIHAMELLLFLVASIVVFGLKGLRATGKDRFEKLVLAMVLGAFLTALLMCNFLPLFGGAYFLPRLAALAPLPFAVVLFGFVRRQGLKARQLRLERAALEAYLPIKATRVLMEDTLIGRGQRLDGVVLFADLRSFSTYCERVEPQHLVRWMDRFFTRMTEVILDEGGMVDKQMGDAVLAVFGVPSPLENAEHHALRAGARMLTALRKLDRELRLERGQPVQMGVGIHRGPLMAGTVGSLLRKTYTVFGDTVNVASRIESQTKGSEFPLQISGDALEALPQELRDACVPLGLHELRGITSAVELHGVPVDHLSRVAASRPAQKR